MATTCVGRGARAILPLTVLAKPVARLAGPLWTINNALDQFLG